MTTPAGSPSPSVRRRDFLKVLGAAGAASGAVGCTQERVEKLIPYLVSPDQTVPGVSTYYSTLCRECSAGCGVVAEVRDGRAIKLEGNPAHPVNHGALCARGQASLQGLYNPDRYRGPMVRRNNALVPATWDEALALTGQRLAGARTSSAGRGVRFISQHEAGSFGAFVDQWMAALGFGSHIAYDAEADLAVRSANRAAYGADWPWLDFAAARLIVSFGADFLETWGANVPQQRSFAEARARLAGAPRFIYVGPRRSLTGLNADEWLPCRPGSELAIVNLLLSALGGTPTTGLAATALETGLTEAQLTRLVDELRAAKPSLVLAGPGTPDAPLVAEAVARLNRVAGNVGVTVKPAEALTSLGGAAGGEALADLAREMTAGSVPLVFVRGANPVYSLPKTAQFLEAFQRVPFKVSFSSYPDETTALCDVVLPDSHALESWGDAEPLRGVLALQQPVMEPVFDTRPTADVLLALAKADPALANRFPWATYRDWLIARYPTGQAGFTAALASGIGQGSASSRAERGVTTGPVAASAPIGGDGDFYLVVQPSPVLGAGAGANKPWLQELPDPVSKICWQSWIEIHPSAAARLGVAPGDHLTVTTPAGSLTAPAWPYLGVRPDTVAMALGQGHGAYGRYAQGIGVNALDALGGVFAAGQLVLTQTKARVAKADGRSPLVSTEGSARQHGRGIARALTAAELAAGPRDEEHHAFPGDASHEFLPGLRSPVANDAQGDLGDPASRDKGMYDPEHWSRMADRRWAMTIDLARCTGCSACVTACYAENNIPTVGARWQGRSLRPFHSDTAGWDARPGANILKGREMAWLRLERYFEGGETGEADFETRFVPMLCQHCGNAPCESVCPVFATYHAPDGLNVQVYNRCVGTRYCSNACPYKVRYFNWHGYGEENRRQYAFPEPLHLQLNPDVTVRAKGVMEKCTFCVQRIRDAENLATLENREVRADEFTTACAQACPSRAIVFGDAASEEWTVARQVEDPRAYHVFEELNTYTAVVYLQKVTHPAAGGAR
jgi:molybdopterin-containing oxidoreductase family iron-sulfur binding subunit